MSTTMINNRIESMSTRIEKATPPYGYGGRSERMQDEQTFKLEAEDQKEFERALKAGAYRTLHKKGMLTDWQLSQLLERLYSGKTEKLGAV